MISIPLIPLGTCELCRHREADLTVSLDGNLADVCSTCYDKADPRDEPEPDEAAQEEWAEYLDWQRGMIS